MTRSRRPLAAVVTAAALLGAGCSSGDSAGSATSAEPPSTTSSAGSDLVLPRGDDPVDLDPATFTVEIDNEYWPMAPGTRWTYREIDGDGNELRVVVTVSSATREIANGITARVVRDTVTQDGEVVEDTVDWYAQDADGNVWYLGEDTAELDNGEISSTAGSFEAGVDGALPGIIMPAEPTDGMRYRQEYLEGEAEDNGEILSTAEQVEVPFGHFDDAVLTKDTITIEPDVLEYKLYASGIGPTLILGVSGGGGREELVELTRVSPDIAEAAGTTPLGAVYG